ncbi:MAG: DUF6517 family protein [Halobacteriota archaeon]
MGTKFDGRSTPDRLSRRRLLSGLGSAGVAGLAGCVGTDVLFGDGAEFEATPARTDDDALSDTGYESYRHREQVVTRTFEAAGQSRTVEVTNRLAEYDRSISVFGHRFQGAIFTVLSTPQIELFGRTFNPVGEMRADELAEEIQARYDRIESIERGGHRRRTVGGEPTDVVRYKAEARPVDVDVDLTVEVTVHLTEAVRAGDDFVVCLAAHPRVFDDTDAVDRLLAGVQHTG